MKLNRISFGLGFFAVVYGCGPFLDAKPDKKLAVITTLEEAQSLLDNDTYMNMRMPSAGEMSADDYYISSADYEGWYSDPEKRTYTWERDHLFDPSSNDWFSIFRCVFWANTVLESIGPLDKQTNATATWNDIKGQALYYRARSFLDGSFIWAKAYDPATAQEDLGLPLRLDPDFNMPSIRSSVKETYDRIVQDLEEAITLLPIAPVHRMRPSRPAAYALLARTYLAMRMYDEAGLYADSCLRLYSDLMDYNDINAVNIDGAFPFGRFNDEVLTVGSMYMPGLLYNNVAKIDTLLYGSYDANDLRKEAFFQENGDGSVGFKGSYDEWAALFTSVATDEVYLIRAESHARAARVGEAMEDLNTLLAKRWRAGTFVPLVAADANEALDIILNERRKELLMRGLRWMDIKRLNIEGRNIVLTRKIGEREYVLPPNDLRYALPIPEDVIVMSGMTQNPRP